MKINRIVKFFFLIFMFFFIHLSVANAVPPLPGRAVPLEDIFVVPSGSNSYVYDESGDIAIITRPVTSQVGSIFSTQENKMNLREDFSASMLLYFGNQGTSAADGMAFVMHADERRVTNFTGATGDSLGVYARRTDNWNASNGTQIMNSFAVEFDTFHNASGLDKNVNQNSGNGHVAWSFPGEESSYIKRPFPFFGQIDTLIHQNINYPIDPLSNDEWHTFTISWEAATRNFTYSFDGNSVVVNIPPSIFGVEDVYWGFTGSTGSQFQESAVAFTQVPGLVNLEKKFEVVNDSNEDINGLVVKANDISTVNFDIHYIGGHQELIDPEIIFELGENSKYQAGTLKLNGEKIDDTLWQSSNYSYILSNLTLENNKANFSFDIKNINDTKDRVETSVSAHIDARNFFSENLRSDFSIERRENVLSLESAEAHISFVSAEIDSLGSLTDDQILKKIIERAGVVATDSDGNDYGISIETTYSDALSNIKSLKVNTDYTLNLIAKRGEEESEILEIIVSHEEGTLRFSSYPNLIEFLEQENTQSSKTFIAVPDSILSINDSREYTNRWKLQVSASDLQNSDGRILRGSFQYLEEASTKVDINSEMQTIHEGTQGIGISTIDISTEWSKNNGLVLQTSNDNYLGIYRGTIKWLLSDAP